MPYVVDGSTRLDSISAALTSGVEDTRDEMQIKGDPLMTMATAAATVVVRATLEILSEHHL
jgi:hypothetical protein